MKDYKVGLYLRLSRDDKNSNRESMSISNQRDLLTDYAAERGWQVEDIYIDDGVSGTTFDRPSFKRMVADIEKKRINLVIVKDLSRFGRNYVKVGEYTDFVFPKHNVRFISVSENIDTDSENDVAAFLNVVNEHYAKDISRKIRISQKTLMKKGYFLGSQPPLGYAKSPEDKHKLIIDEDGAKIVKRMFHMYSIGYTARHIADTFNQEGMQEIYTGDMVQGKTYSYNCKINKREPLPREKWDIVRNTHESIISKEQFELAQSLLAKKAKPVKSAAKSIPSIYSGFLTCADCGKKMVRNTAYYTDKSNGKTAYYRYICSTYKKIGSKACSSHLIREDVLNDIVMDVLNTMIKSLVNVAKTMQKAESTRLSKQIALLENDKYKVREKIKKTSKLLEGLYTDYKEEIISLTEYKDMKKSFENRRDELIEKADTLINKISQLESGGDLMDENIEKYLSYEGIVQIDRNILIDLVEEIIIDKNRDITINLNAQDELKKYCSFLDM